MLSCEYIFPHGVIVTKVHCPKFTVSQTQDTGLYKSKEFYCSMTEQGNGRLAQIRVLISKRGFCKEHGEVGKLLLRLLRPTVVGTSSDSL